MKLKYVITAIATTSLLIACGDNGTTNVADETFPTSFLSEDGMSSYLTPNIPLDSKCFYQTRKAAFPQEKDIRKYRWFKFVAFKIEDDGFPRQYEIIKGSNTEAELQEYLKIMKFKPPYEDWNKKRHWSQLDQEKPSQTIENAVQGILAAAPASDFAPIPLSEIQTQAGITNPMNLELHYFSINWFLVLNDEVQFARNNPHRVQVGKPGNLPPYYGPSRVSNNGKVISFNYWSHPDYIKDRRCTYKYELEMAAIRTSGGRLFTMPLILDPGETNNGTPPPSGEGGGTWP